MKAFQGIVFVGFALFLFCCGGSDSSEPTAIGVLSVETTISGGESGLVNFQASADHAIKFIFSFGEGLNEPFTATDGKAAHTYLSSGTYTVEIFATSSDNTSARKTVDVIVKVKELPIPTTGYTTPATYPGLTLAWQDEFSGNALNLSNWNYEKGPFNNELQFYKQENTTVQDGYLIIKAKVEKVEGKVYTSSRLTTQNKKVFQYGRVDIRALVPKGQGLFPALWMLGSSFATVNWPKCGEIDIMETVGGGGRDSVVYGTAHWDNVGEHVLYGGHKGLQDGHVLGDQFHVYSIVWTSKEIKWYFDDVLYHVIDITPDDLSELRSEFFFIFNVAVGGEWAGSPDATTVFPQRMVVDYIRVFQ